MSGGRFIFMPDALTRLTLTGSPVRVLVTASRDLPEDGVLTLVAVLSMLAGKAWREGYRYGVVVHGASGNGDEAAARWATAEHGWTDEPHPAPWATYGRAAGLVRNQHMVDLGASVCLAFIGSCTREHCRRGPEPHGSHGATDCADRAEAAGIRTFRWGPR